MPQITGKFVKMLAPVEGEKDGREWIRTQFAIMTMDNNPKIVAFECFGHEKVDIVKTLQPSQTVIVDYTPESREFNERYYTSLNMVMLQVAVRMQAAATPVVGTSPQPSSVVTEQMQQKDNGDMYGEEAGKWLL